MKLSAWAKKQGVTYRTAWNLYKAGQVPNAYTLATGTIIVPEEKEPQKDFTVVYARVSSAENRANLETQALRVSSFCAAKGWEIKKIVKECASGLNDQRPKLLALLSDPKVTRIVVEHKDRLTRFGFNYLTIFPGKEIVVINEAQNNEQDLMTDFVSLVTSFTARLYGRRRAKRRTEEIIRSLEVEK